MTDTPPRPRRLRRILKIFVGLVLVMVLIVALLPTCMSTSVGRSWVESRIGSSLNREASLDDFDAGWGSGLLFSGLSVKNPEGFSGDPLLEVKSLLVKPALLPSLGGALEADIELRDATLRIERKADGTSNLDGMGGEEEKAKGEKKDEAAAEVRLRVVLENVTILQTEEDETGVKETRIEDLDLELTLTGAGKADLGGKLALTIARVASHELTTGSVSLNATGENGVWKLENVDVPVSGGHITAAGTLDLSEDGAFEGSAEVKGIQLTKGFPLLSYVLPIFALDAGGEAEGTLSATVKLKGEGTDLDALKAALAGNGEILVEKGTIRGNGIVTQALALTENSGALSFDELGTTFEIRGQRIYTDGVKLGGGSVKLKLDGSVGFDGSVAYTLGVKPKGGSWKQVRKVLGENPLKIAVTGSLGALDIATPKPEDLLKGALEKGIGDLIGK